MFPKNALIAAWVAVLGGQSNAKSIVETYEGAAVNWSSLKITYSGEATPKEHSDMKELELEAIKGAGVALAPAIEEIRKACGNYAGADASRHAVDAAKRVANSAAVTNTTYFSDGRVKVELEGALPKALLPVGVGFSTNKVTEAPKATGIVLNVEGTARPGPIFQIQDPAGNILFSVKDLASDAYYRNLMGRWLKAPTGAETRDIVGAEPATMNVKAAGPGILISTVEAWEATYRGNEGLFQNAKIVLQVK